MAIAVMALCGEDYGGMGVNDAIIIHTFYLMVTLERISVMFPLLPPLCTCRRRLLFLPRRSPSNQGFTLFEVSVALMMSILFLTGTLNAMVVATIFQVKAERQAQASDWIQEDLEEVRALAASYSLETPTNACGNVGDTFNSDSDNGLDSLPAPNNREIVGVNASLTRNPGTPGTPDNPSNITTLDYKVTANGETLATLYTEVLPAAALDCP